MRRNFGYPPAQNQYMQGNILANQSLREYMRGLYSHSREYRKRLFSNYFLNALQNIGGEFISMRIHAAIVFAPSQIQEQFWRIIYVLVSCQGVFHAIRWHKTQEPLNGGFQMGGLPDLDLYFLLMCLFVLSGTAPIFRSFPNFSRNFPE